MEKRLTLPQQRAEETRNWILQAAAKVFTRDGYGEASMDDVVAEAGVSKGALYHHFPSKEQLFQALCLSHLEQDREMGTVLRPGGRVREAIQEVVKYWLEHIKTARDLQLLTMEFWMHATRQPAMCKIIGNSFEEGRAMIAGMLSSGQSAGLIRQDVDVDAAALLLTSLFQGLFVQWAVDESGVDLARAEGPIVDLVERFLATAPKGSERATGPDGGGAT